MTSNQTIRFHRKTYTVIDKIRIGDTRYSVVERLGCSTRPVFRVIESGPTRLMRCLHLLPSTPQTKKRIQLLTHASLPHANLPIIIRTRYRAADVAVVTKWIDGPTLEEYLQDCHRGREPWPSPMIVMNLIRGLAKACLLLHERLGLVHGDIHPANIVLCRHTKKLVLVDFGSAWRIEHSASHDGGDGMARGFAAPEWMEPGSHIGYACDQFSVMTVGYLMLTGELPYEGLGGKAKEYQSELSIDFVAPSERLRQAGGLPVQHAQVMDELFRQSLRMDARERFLSSRDWLNQIHHVANQLSVPNSVQKHQSQWTWLERLQAFAPTKLFSSLYLPHRHVKESNQNDRHKSYDSKGD